ncbi:uncharacterized protein LOC133188019 [Saccostrea echinata]|uniref:uncharacterized protein LOC133188019 n=1 Tax=Saccostrea echinata TaxID=191078 RepID=UPI002A824ED1|nr:uncharacterized protein LOC133188019 [Saccostrea echinata]
MSETSIADTANILSQSHSVMYPVYCNDESQTAQKEISLGTLHDLLLQINSRLAVTENNNTSLDKRLCEIENKMTHFQSITDSITTLNERVNKFESEVKDVKQIVSSIEASAQSMSDMFENVKSHADQDLRSIRIDTANLDKKLTSDITELSNGQRELEKSVIDLKSRSMRDNLVFTGIPENREENCEDVLRDFLKTKLKIHDEIPFERVHRLGKPDEFRTKPRNIVAKFSFYKDREFVRKRAPLKLKGSNIWVNEQFPPEVEEKRRKLYPVMRKAMKENRRVKLVVDKLYIDGKMYEPNATQEHVNAPSYPTRRMSESSRNTPWTSGARGGPALDDNPTPPPRGNKRARKSSTPTK